MSTPRERQDVARRLRVIGSDPQEFYMPSEVVAAVTGDWRSTEVEFARELADLIDPTCHGEDVVGGRHVKCSACHTPWADPARVRYCPNCGCRRIFLDDSTEGASSTRREGDECEP